MVNMWLPLIPRLCFLCFRDTRRERLQRSSALFSLAVVVGQLLATGAWRFPLAACVGLEERRFDCAHAHTLRSKLQTEKGTGVLQLISVWSLCLFIAEMWSLSVKLKTKPQWRHKVTRLLKNLLVLSFTEVKFTLLGFYKLPFSCNWKL